MGTRTMQTTSAAATHDRSVTFGDSAEATANKPQAATRPVEDAQDKPRRARRGVRRDDIRVVKTFR